MGRTKYKYRIDQAGALWVSADDNSLEELVCSRCVGLYDGPPIGDSSWLTNIEEPTAKDLLTDLRDYMVDLYDVLNNDSDVRGVTQSYE